MKTAQGRFRPGQVLATMWINLEIRKALKVAAAMDGITMQEKLHEILCREFERPDLMPIPSTSDS